MLTPVKHRNWIRACSVLEQSRVPGSNAVRWAPYASRWTLACQHPLHYEIISQFCSHKNKGNAAMSQALSVTYSLNSLLQISVFLNCWCALYWGLKTHHVSLFKALCFKTLSCLCLKQLVRTAGLWKIVSTQGQLNVKRWVLAFGTKLLPSPTIPVTQI